MSLLGSVFLRRDAQPALLAMGGAVVDEGPTGIKAPDGGWGWAVLFGCFVITGFSYAFPKAVSVFFKELMREFGIGYSDTAWISSILLAMLYGTAGSVGDRQGHLVSAAQVLGRLQGNPGEASAREPWSPHGHTGHTSSLSRTFCCELRFAQEGVPTVQCVREPLWLPARHAHGGPPGVPGHGGRVLLQKRHPALSHHWGDYWPGFGAQLPAVAHHAQPLLQQAAPHGQWAGGRRQPRVPVRPIPAGPAAAGPLRLAGRLPHPGRPPPQLLCVRRAHEAPAGARASSGPCAAAAATPAAGPERLPGPRLRHLRCGRLHHGAGALRAPRVRGELRQGPGCARRPGRLSAHRAGLHRHLCPAHCRLHHRPGEGAALLCLPLQLLHVLQRLHRPHGVHSRRLRRPGRLLHLLRHLLRHGGSPAVRGAHGYRGHSEVLQRHRPRAAAGGRRRAHWAPVGRQAPGRDARLPVRVCPGGGRGAGLLPRAGAGQLLLH
ncbi:monocarboxylate transporter 4 isoform X9 [Mustela putorius furo]|uniref:Monocarboxylate transporter 4 isoform X9 n=1 Tax=Mustela putorius furo TaxID=9669 RepID=A0A8U0SER2_MUSPF|nr:monocarboxylate transporter 4 isoform X9 [Mustela putorius furo]